MRSRNRRDILFWALCFAALAIARVEEMDIAASATLMRDFFDRDVRAFADFLFTKCWNLAGINGSYENEQAAFILRLACVSPVPRN